jgi:hypothetical protein
MATPLHSSSSSSSKYCSSMGSMVIGKCSTCYMCNNYELERRAVSLRLCIKEEGERREARVASVHTQYGGAYAYAYTEAE